MVQRKNHREVGLPDSITASGQGSDNPGGRRRIAILAGADQSLKIFIAKSHHLFGRPVGIVGQTVFKGRQPLIGHPLLGIEGFILEVTDRAKLRVVGSFPSRGVDSQADDVFGAGAAVPHGLIPFSGCLGPFVPTPQRHCKIDQKMANKGDVVFHNQHIDRGCR